MTHTYEVEVKSLLGSKENYLKLKQLLLELRPTTKLISRSKHLNHYFKDGEVGKVYDVLAPHIPQDRLENFKHVVINGENPSVRTRDSDGTVSFVVKAGIAFTSGRSLGSTHGVERIEFDTRMNMDQVALDKLIEAAGFSYQAKWSREREEYDSGDFSVCLDLNAGYGYLAEFERVVERMEDVAIAKAEILSLMDSMGVVELPQDRLDRMFAHYNTHWPEYYGTDKIFLIK